jgi:alpha-ketoglutarate-dependent taurine dioxygenase
MVRELEITHLEARFGAEVHGFDPRAELDDHDRRTLRRAFDERKLLVFPGLDVNLTRQGVLAEMLIGIETSSAAADDDVDDEEALAMSYVSNERPGAASPFGRLLFHSDTMWSDRPFRVLSLYAVKVEPPVVPTMFACTSTAWKSLPPALQERVSGLEAFHSAGQYKRDPNDDIVESLPDQPKSTTQPIALTEPRTDDTLLYVNEQMSRHVVGLPADQSDELLRQLFEYLYDPANVIDHEWRQGDLVVWDNLAVQHARPNVEEDGAVRTLRRFASPMDLFAEEDKTYHYTRMS